MALIDQYSKEELSEIVKSCFSLKQVISKLGYSTTGGNNSVTVKKRLQLWGIDTSHFTSTTPIKRNIDNIFIENSTASQQTLRRWYEQGEYTPYVCAICGQEPLWCGKPMTLILDHINGHNHDNRLENLRWVCPNCNIQLETTGYKTMRTENKPQKKYYCCDCGAEISRGAIRCRICSDKQKQFIVKSIDRNELKQLIRIQPFTKIGEQYGVSDNAIRKWCEKFSLPTKKKDIQKLTDEEWEKL